MKIKIIGVGLFFAGFAVAGGIFTVINDASLPLIGLILGLTFYVALAFIVLRKGVREMGKIISTTQRFKTN